MEWLAPRRTALLADEMGLGKSAQAIVAADRIGAERILVVCPAVARPNWLREFEKFSTRSRPWQLIDSGNEPLRTDASIVSSYDLTERHADLFCTKFDLLILDECHYLKSPDAKRTIAILGTSGCVRYASRVWGLSGTPAPNHAAELWPLLYTFGATKLSYRSWVERYCNYYPMRRRGTVELQVTGTKKAMIPELRSILNQHMLRRRKEDVLTELPPISFHDIVVEPSPVDIEAESSFVQYTVPAYRRQELADKLVAEQDLVERTMKLTKVGTMAGTRALEALATSVSTLRRYIGLQKVPKTAELIAEELASGAYEKIVIFAIHRDVIEGLRVRLAKYKPVTLYGGTAPEKRQHHIDKFMREPKCRVFIGNIVSCGTAISLTAAHQVVFIEQDWVPGNNAQAAMRCHRIGQAKPVTVRFVGVADSIDETVARVLRRKTKELSAIFDGRETQDERLEMDISEAEAFRSTTVAGLSDESGAAAEDIDIFS